MGSMYSRCLIFLFIFSSSISLADLVLANSLPPTLQQKHHRLCHDQEKQILLAFKQSLFVDCSIKTASTDAYPKVASWKSEDTEDCCSWDGVKCHEETGHVIGLGLSDSCLYGSFPRNSTIFTLNHLLHLNLANNDFNYSRVPAAIGNLRELVSLNMSNSQLSGPIPEEITRLTLLSVLDLSSNGDPTSNNLELHNLGLEKLAQNLTHLKVLNLSYVDISSEVPIIFSNLSSLEYIVLPNCNLLGNFPKSILELPNLEVLDISGNRNLLGYLPDFPPNSPLRSLSVSKTAFYGEVPSSFGQLGSLSALDLGSSNFSGHIPSSLGNLTRLGYLDLSDNSFVGELPSLVTNLTELYFLDLSDLNVSHEKLCSWLVKLKKIEILGTSSMNSCIANVTSLQRLHLDSNKYVGPLPHWFSNLTQLAVLDLGSTQLQGQVPRWLTRLTNIEQLILTSDQSASDINTFLQLPKLNLLALYGVSLTFPLNESTNSSLPKFCLLILSYCNLTSFPEFLRNQDKLQMLSLQGNSIPGTIPQWFVNTTRESLSQIDLAGNLFTGFEKPSVFLPWPYLKALTFDDNKFQGPLPIPSKSIQAYLVYNNQFTGVITKDFCSANSLLYLDLSYNNLSGKIPHCIFRPSSLMIFDLQTNNLSGIMPQTYAGSCKLKMINLSKNQLDGQLPKWLSKCMTLEVLDIGKNHVTDTFPTWLGSLPQLRVLILRENNFHGVIAAPMSSNHFNSLNIIDLSQNFHTGDFPYGYLPNWHSMMVSDESLPDKLHTMIQIKVDIKGTIFPIEYGFDYDFTVTYKGSSTLFMKMLNVFRLIDFSSNNFTGRIPDTIGDLKGIQALNLSNNDLDGHIPSALADLRNLQSLDLSYNKLSGEIPHELTQMTFLQIFSVSHNQLVGPIPQGKQFSTFDSSSYDANVALCGPPSSMTCGHLESSQPSQKNSEADSQNSEMVEWVIRLCGTGSGLVVGFIIGKIYLTDKHHEWFMDTFGNKGRPKTKARRAAR